MQQAAFGQTADLQADRSAFGRFAFLFFESELTCAQFQVFLPLALALKNSRYCLFLIRLYLTQAAADFEQSSGTVDAAACHVLAAAFNAQVILSAVADLDGQSGIILLEHVIPNVKRSIALGGEEHAGASRRPAAIGEVRGMIPAAQKSPSVLTAQRQMGWLTLWS